MRVLLATPYPLASVSGVASFVRALRDGLAPTWDSAVVEPRTNRTAPGLGNGTLALRTAREMIRLRRAYEVVHAQQLHPQSLAAGLMGRALGKAVVLTVHGLPPRLRGLRGWFLDSVERAALRVPHRLVFVAKSLREARGGAGGVIPNGVPVGAIQDAKAARASVRREMGLGMEFLLLFVGRVTTDKGVWTLLEAFDSARRHRPEMRLALLGPLADDVRQALDSHGPWESVRFLGPLPNAWRHLAAADAFVLPSTREGLPLSLLEAMAAGLPVIATRVGDVPDLVRDRETGLLTNPGDVPSLAASIEWVCAHANEARAMGVRASDLVSSRYDLGRMCEAYRAEYEQALVALGSPARRG